MAHHLGGKVFYTIDFETTAIIPGSNKCPTPVGVSVKCGDEPSHYYAWDHPYENNCTEAHAGDVLNDICSNARAHVVFHNAKFDMRIIIEFFAIPIKCHVHDTMILAYLYNPRIESLSLKWLAENLLKIPPTAQTDLKNWLVSSTKASVKNFGAFISLAPGDIVGKYAESDTDMTYALYQHLYPRIESAGMRGAYYREVSLLPIVINMEMRGLCVTPDIHDKLSYWETVFNAGEERLKQIGGHNAEPGKKSMFNSLLAKGLINKDKLQYTDKGNVRFGREFLETYIDDVELKAILSTRSKLQKIIGTYLRPWAESAKLYGRVYPYYSQTRDESGTGTRTGRFSSDMQQMPRSSHHGMPNLRSMIVPEPGHVFIKRDFSGQELRVAAHYAEGKILQAYNENSKLDVHQWVIDMIKEHTGMVLDRDTAKTMNFLKLYGGGATLLAEKLGIELSKAKSIFEAYDKAIPEFKGLMQSIEKQSRSGKQIRTWGGRLYDVEPPEVVNGKRREFYYKLGNVLIQGSSADMTKEAMIRYCHHPDRKGQLVLTVHDELVVSVNPDNVDSEMKILRWAMDKIPGWDVPLRSDGKVGANFGEMVKYED